MVAGPLTLVRDAFASDQRVRTVQDLVERTGLNRDVVDAALEHLLFTGDLQATALAAGCPAEACDTCAVAGHGCPAQGVGRARGFSRSTASDSAMRTRP
jgi:hypothetical protein